LDEIEAHSRHPNVAGGLGFIVQSLERSLYIINEVDYDPQVKEGPTVEVFSSRSDELARKGISDFEIV
jgi:hypothetical protein